MLTYPNGTRALDSTDLDSDKGRFAFLIGACGTGKSRLPSLLYRGPAPTRGAAVPPPVSGPKDGGPGAAGTVTNAVVNESALGSPSRMAFTPDAVLGLSSSSQAGLLAEIDKLGTNLLTVANGQTLFGQTAELPLAAPGMIARIGPVQQVQYTGSTSANVYRSRLISSVNTNALSVQAASRELPQTVGATIAAGSYLNAATAQQPVAVLGAAAAASAP